MLLIKTARLAGSRTLMLSRSASSTSARPVSLITPAELHKLLSSKNEEELPCVLDASWHMPGSGRQPFQEYRKKRIEGAAFWDVDQIASKSDVGVPHNMPSVSQFEDACSRLGIKRDSHVVVYDTVGVFSSPRTAFTFKHFNHPQVSVLDGGLPRWIAEGYPIDENRPTNPNPHAVEEGGRLLFGPIFSELLYAHKPRVESYFIADIEENFSEYKVDGREKADVRQWKDMNKNIKKGEKGDVVVDARAAGRFYGTDPEPREGLSSGHMPHSISLPFQSVLSPESSTTPPYRCLLKPEELEKVFVDALGKEKWDKVKQGEKLITATCGSGMTAAVLWLALQRAGVTDNTAIYDESWTGYASRPESKIVKS
ncbi:thiosulfate/3-mercaptopyruvate sulfurtransferase [Rhodotorula toruloides]|uniref:Thiosulfate/3-mercaptopyruvate sulfurtransferase n=1 Tax=Rhodotorula toruloides TaxID=5286 RepID=A0A511KG72_RHOTO|nr:thiosulfate/3-mercaptopyruvate sulfurtransferase [Rhodotorula toruloides]